MEGSDEVGEIRPSLCGLVRNKVDRDGGRREFRATVGGLRGRCPDLASRKVNASSGRRRLAMGGQEEEGEEDQGGQGRGGRYASERIDAPGRGRRGPAVAI